MVNIKEDLTGWIMKEHNVPDSKLTVISRTEDFVDSSGRKTPQWLCKCECGKKVKVRGSYLKSGHTKSCGCYKKNKRRKTNKYDLSGSFGIGYCTNTGNPFYFDLEDYDKIKDYTWYETKNAKTNLLMSRDFNSNMPIRMHILLGYKNYDHINRNELDNRKENLRECTKSENAMNCPIKENNTSGFTGVSFDKKQNKWHSYIGINGKRINIGKFNNKDDAIRARLKAEKEYFGEFAGQKNLFEEWGIK